MNNTTKKTLVLGASANPARYSHMAINMLRSYGHPVVAIGKRKTEVADVAVATENEPFEGVHTVTLYLNAGNQQPFYNYIIALHPQRIIFNPGAENPELVQLVKEHGIATMNACTLVLLSTGQF